MKKLILVIFYVFIFNTSSFALVTLLKDPKAKIPQEFTDSYEALLDQADLPDTDKALLARALTLPDFVRVANDQDVVDPQAIQAARKKIKDHLAKAFESKFLKIFNDTQDKGSYKPTAEDKGKRQC